MPSSTTSSTNKKPALSRLKTVALPASYGSWSLVSEPILLGLLAAPSWPGLFIAVAGLLTFLLNQPFKIILADRQRGRHFARTCLAWRVARFYLLLLAVFLLAFIGLVGWQPLLPLAMAIPLLLVFIIYDNRPGRSWQAELAAPAAFSAIAAAIPLAAGWDLASALPFWAIMIARADPAVLYVRARLRLAKGQPARLGPALGAHLLALAAVAILNFLNLAPPTALFAFLILLLRAALGLSPWRRSYTPMTLGWIETAIGLCTVLLVALGYWIY
jgi:hypothetical protein